MNEPQFGQLPVRRKTFIQTVSVPSRAGLPPSEAARLWSRLRDLGLPPIVCLAAPEVRWEFDPIRNPETRDGGVARIRSELMSPVTTEPDSLHKAFHDAEVLVRATQDQIVLREAVVDQFAQLEGK